MTAECGTARTHGRLAAPAAARERLHGRTRGVLTFENTSVDEEAFECVRRRHRSTAQHATRARPSSFRAAFVVVSHCVGRRFALRPSSCRTASVVDVRASSKISIISFGASASQIARIAAAPERWTYDTSSVARFAAHIARIRVRWSGAPVGGGTFAGGAPPSAAAAAASAQTMRTRAAVSRVAGHDARRSFPPRAAAPPLREHRTSAARSADDSIVVSMRDPYALPPHRLDSRVTYILHELRVSRICSRVSNLRASLARSDGRRARAPRPRARRPRGKSAGSRGSAA